MGEFGTLSRSTWGGSEAGEEGRRTVTLVFAALIDEKLGPAGRMLARSKGRYPQGVLLEPGVSPWYFHQEEVPRGGLRVRRTPSVARWLDGTPYFWVSRGVGAGRGEASSGLRFDI